MTSALLLSALVLVFLSCAVAEDRPRTTRRSFEVEVEETEFITSYDSFLNDAEGTVFRDTWPAGSDPLSEFGVLQTVGVSDMLVQLCLMSGVYVRPHKKNTDYNETAANMTMPPEKKEESGNPPPEKKGGGEGRLLSELLDLLDLQKRRKRQAAETTTTATTTAETTTTTQGPPVEDWQHDPYDLLEDIEYQFTNLCYTLFDLRRLNRKLSKQKQQTLKKKQSTY